MKAILSMESGGPESLVVEEVAQPFCNAGEVLIRVAACGVNYPDALMIEDRYQVKPPRPFSPGTEIAGVVEDVGSDVEHVRSGDRVLASVGHGGMADYAVADSHSVMAIPDTMPFDEAAAFMMTYGTSHYALTERGRGRPGETLLVLGAAGGVGIAAVELGKALGLTVIAACSSQEKVDFCLSKGADQGLVYPSEDLGRAEQKEISEKIKSLSGGGVDIVYDAVGGNYSEPALRALNWEGRFLVVGFPSGIASIPLNLALLKSCDIKGVFWGAAVARDPVGHASRCRDMFELYKSGKIRPHVSATYPLHRAGEAICELTNRRAMGKLVVTCK